MGFEEALFSLVCAGPFVVLAAFAALVVWWTQRGADRKRIDRLEREVLSLRSIVNSIAQPAMAARVAEIGRAREATPEPEPAATVTVTETVTETVTDHGPQVTDDGPRITDDGSPTTDHEPRTADPPPETASQPWPRPWTDAIEPPAPPSPPEPPRGGDGDDGDDGGNGGWERLVGVRAAAALGALVLVLAGLYFFRYSIEHGLISPAVRVALGTVVGLACVVSSETWLRRRY